MSAHPSEGCRRTRILPPAGLVTSMISQGEGRHRPRRILPILLLCAIAATAGVAYWYGFAATKAAPSARPAARAVPVTVALAVRQDVPVYATGLGTVQAYVTVADRRHPLAGRRQAAGGAVHGGAAGQEG
jgi:hypothetical protein